KIPSHFNDNSTNRGPVRLLSVNWVQNEAKRGNSADPDFNVCLRLGVWRCPVWRYPFGYEPEGREFESLRARHPSPAIPSFRLSPRMSRVRNHVFLSKYLSTHLRFAVWQHSQFHVVDVLMCFRST